MRKLLFGLVFLSMPAAAQISAPPFNLYPSIGAQMIQKQIDAQRGRSAGSAKGARQALAKVPIARLSFASSEQRRRDNYARFLERVRRQDPAGAANLAETLNSDPISRMGPALAEVGLRTDNVADAYAVYWVEAWQAAHGATGASSRQTADVVKRQAASALLATPEFSQATDAQKQEFADALLVQALLIGAARDQSRGDPDMLRQIAAAVRQGARASGLNLDAMTLTPQGFVPAGETGAVDVAPGGSGEGQAFAATEEGASAAEPSLVPGEVSPSVAIAKVPSDSPSYVLIAVAGGAGLGAAFLLGRAKGRKG